MCTHTTTDAFFVICLTLSIQPTCAKFPVCRIGVSNDNIPARCIKSVYLWPLASIIEMALSRRLFLQGRLTWQKSSFRPLNNLQRTQVTFSVIYFSI